MFDLVQKFLEDMSAEFAAGDVDAVMRRLSLPTAIYFGSDAILIRDRHDLEELTGTYLRGLQQSGVFKSRPVLKALTLPKNGKITAWTTSYLEDACGNRIGESRAKYFLRKTERGLKVELTEHSEAPLGSGEVHDVLQELAI